MIKLNVYAPANNLPPPPKKNLNSPSEINFSRISQAKIVGLSLLYDSIFATTSGVATLGFDPPIMPGTRPAWAGTGTGFAGREERTGEALL